MWLHARIEGQRFVMAFCKEIQKILGIEGIESVIPAADGRFCSVTKPDPKRVGNWQDASYTSNWSERHVAFVCGLGTFGLSKGIITEKGMAGRLGSLIVTETFEARKRKYTDLYEYCTRLRGVYSALPRRCDFYGRGKEVIAHVIHFWNQRRRRTLHGMGAENVRLKVPCESRIPK